jgi:hypothetical protein
VGRISDTVLSRLVRDENALMTAETGPVRRPRTAPFREATTVIARNPQTVHRPVADYHHQIEIPDGGRWLMLSGQIGMSPAGHRPCTTLLYVVAPADPALRVEIDACAHAGPGSKPGL